MIESQPTSLQDLPAATAAFMTAAAATITMYSNGKSNPVLFDQWKKQLELLSPSSSPTGTVDDNNSDNNNNKTAESHLVEYVYPEMNLSMRMKGGSSSSSSSSPKSKTLSRKRIKKMLKLKNKSSKSASAGSLASRDSLVFEMQCKDLALKLY